ncbi:MAG: hypothetical protein U1E73_04885 [Planctomycetota bacterium]
MPARFYIDTSAYLAILLRHGAAAELADELRGQRLLSSVLLVLEVQRNLVRFAREKAMTTEQFLECSDRLRHDIEGFHLREVTLDLCTPATMPAATLPRSLDLLHLRTAFWFHAQEPIRRFVSLDRGQNQAARELGLPV